jgi:hypothetical protein
MRWTETKPNEKKSIKQLLFLFRAKIDYMRQCWSSNLDLKFMHQEL